MDVHSLTLKHRISWWRILLPTVVVCLNKCLHAFRGQITKPSSRFALSLFISLSIINTAQANESNVLILKSGSAPVYNRIINTAKQRVDHICNPQGNKCIKPLFSVESVNNKKLRTIIKETKWDLIVTIGTKAAIKINSYKIKTPTLYSLIPSHSYPTIRRNSISRVRSAIYIDQPLQRQIQLIKSSLPKTQKVGVLLGKHSGISKKRLQQIIRNMGLEPVVLNTSANNIKSSLDSIYGKIDVLLAQPDPSIYNKKTVMTVLLSSYHHNVPVFGYSAAFVRSGATAAIYSSPTNIGLQVGDEIVKFIKSNNRALSPPGFPNYFSIDTNRRVIRSLNIKLPTTKQIKARILEAR
jgi:ABC-type uncharacterized transport system substrate-binding protein